MTIQTSWRPQLSSSSKEIANNSITKDNNNSQQMERKLKKDMTNTNKKWSLGRIFRKKKDAQQSLDSSSDEDRKAGFVSSSQKQQRKKDTKKTRGNRIIGAGFDHIVISPKENEIFLPLGRNESVTLDNKRLINSFDRRSKRERKRVATLKQYQSSSEDEMKSHNSYNSSSISRYRSDESTGSVGGGSNNRKSRSARNERYFKRIGRDDSCRSPQMLEESKQAGKWKIKSAADVHVHSPKNVIEQFDTRSANSLRSSGSLSHVPFLRVAMGLEPSTSNCEQHLIQSNIHDSNINKRSMSYDNQMHLQNKNFEEKAKTPPPPPPRDPQRRLNIHHGELRPISYAFDKAPFASDTINNRCVSDDRLWGPHGSVYQSFLSQRPSSTQPTIQSSPQHKWLTRKMSECETLQNEIKSNKEIQNYKYVADSIPRSRKPIHILNQDEAQNIQPQFSTSSLENPTIIRTTKSGLPATPMQSASDFWRKLEKANSFHKGRETDIARNLKPKPRSVSCSRVEEPRSYHSPMLENLYKNQNVITKNEGKYWMMGQRHSRNKSDPINNYLQYEGGDKYEDVNEIDRRISSKYINKLNCTRSSSSFDDNSEDNQWSRLISACDDAKKYTRDFENVVNGSLFIKPVIEKNLIEVSSKPNYGKTNSMPNYYHRNLVTTKKSLTPPPTSKEKRENNSKMLTLDYNRNVVNKQKRIMKKDNDNPPQILSNQPSNLEDAIYELETIYKSLKLGDEDLLERAERRDIPTPTNFEKYAQPAEEYDEDDDEETGEPDIIKDDVVYRTIKRSNNVLKVVDPQPPFGIPLGPIPPSPRTDYLHVTPDKDSKKNRCVPHNNIPDIIGDDLAVRALRKDSPGSDQPKFSYPVGAMKKRKATRTQSANIYTLIQRDAAKPSGGDLHNYIDFGKNLEKSGSMSDIRKQTDDIPSTLYLLRNLQNEEKKSQYKQSIFRHPSEGGAVYNLPTILKANISNSDSFTHKPPIPLPRKSLSPAPLTSELSRSSMEEVLNQIAKEAKESSEKLSRDLEALRKEAIIKSQNSKKEEKNKPNLKENITDVESRSDILYSKYYKKTLQEEAVPSQSEENQSTGIQCRKLGKGKEFLTDINNVSESAKAYKKVLENIVTKHPSAIQMHKTFDHENNKEQNKKENESLSSVSANNSGLNGNLTSKELSKVTDINQNVELLESSSKMAVASLFEKIDPNTEKIGQIATRCMRQIGELNDLTDARVSQGSIYDNVKLMANTVEVNSKSCKNAGISSENHVNMLITSVVPGQSEQERVDSSEDDSLTKNKKKELEHLNSMESNHNNLKLTSTNEENRISDGSGGVIFSSSDCLKSTSPSLSIRHLSSSITSLNSSSDYMKSSNSSDTNPLSTDPIKTFSTTSCDVKSTSTTPNNDITNTTPSSRTPSPPFNHIKPIGGNTTTLCGSNNNISDYNSSDELAMIFGIDQCSPTTTTIATTTLSATTKNTGNTLEIANACDHLTTSPPSFCYTRNANNTIITAIMKDHTLSLMSFLDENDDVNDSNNNKNNNEFSLTKLSEKHVCVTSYNCNDNSPSSLSASSSSSLISSNNLNTMMMTTVPTPEIISNFSSSSDFNNDTFALHKSLITVNPKQNMLVTSYFASNNNYCLDTIPELHDDSNFDEICMFVKHKNNNDENDDDDNENILNNFSNKMHIVINNATGSSDDNANKTKNENDNETNNDDIIQQYNIIEFDALNAFEELSNPDSGNVSLNEFPVLPIPISVHNVKNSVINTSYVGLSVIHTNSLYLEIPFDNNNNQYSFINQIDIKSTDDASDDNNIKCDDDDNKKDETVDIDKNIDISNSVISIKDINNSNTDDIHDNSNENDDHNSDDQTNLSKIFVVNSVIKNCLDDDVDDDQIEMNVTISNNPNQNINEQRFCNINNNDMKENASTSNNFIVQESLINKSDHNEIRQRSSTIPKVTEATNNNNSSLSCLLSNSNSSKHCLTIISNDSNNDENENQQEHGLNLNYAVILACTYSLINNDIYTILAIVVAITLLVAFIML